MVVFNEADKVAPRRDRHVGKARFF